MDISDIFPTDGKPQRIYCGNCNCHSDLAYTDFDELISGVKIQIIGLPILRCPDCGEENLPNQSRIAIISLHKKAFEDKQTSTSVTRRKRDDNFDFTDVPFAHDPDDYFYIPGLYRSFNIGFLQPVFFNRSALLKYDNSPDYRVRYASTTYGSIVTDDYDISFGINRFGNLVMWLGDIAKLPKNEQYYLLSENLSSDHSIGSEFYDGQIECKFTDLSKEDMLFKARSEFVEKAFLRFGQQIAHFETETYDLVLSFNPPVVDTAKERRHVADTLNKIYIESFDNNALKAILKSLNVNADGTGSLKRLQAIIKKIVPTEDIATLMSPLYVLYDFRVNESHLKSKNNITDRLDVSSNAPLSKVYEKLVVKLTGCFEQLSKLVEK